ncbi:hypothetical protein [Burkholderia cepacia]|uniref:hypothetical protein n=1 Tax=Burkholderia cepacia TaxID=292 RepID=UPI000B322949|nr:hypothetical protein [Burkholderia cepacia]
MEPVTSLFELLHDSERFELFEDRMWKYGWIPGDELGATRKALQRPLTKQQLERLVNYHDGTSMVGKFNVHCNEINCGKHGFVCILYDSNRFDTFNALYEELEAHGYEIKRR